MQAERTSRESAIDKVRKMLALAAEDSGASEAERMLAAQRAQEFMFRHNLDALEIEADEGSGPEFGRDEELIVGMANHWRGRLLASIGRQVNVHVHFRGGRDRKRRTYVMVGRPDQVAFVRELANYLIPYLELECEAALRQAIAEGQTQECWKCHGEGVIHDRDMSFASRYCSACDGVGERPVHTRTFRGSFYEAATSRIGTRLYTQRREMERAAEEASPTGMELVRNDRAALESYVEQTFPDLRTGRASRGSYSPGGVAAGHAAGDRADLSPGTKLRGSQRELGSG